MTILNVNIIETINVDHEYIFTDNLNLTINETIVSLIADMEVVFNDYININLVEDLFVSQPPTTNSAKTKLQLVNSKSTVSINS